MISTQVMQIQGILIEARKIKSCKSGSAHGEEAFCMAFPDRMPCAFARIPL
jgi:hypothetical protein